jgi:hypothetical protein
MFLLNWQNCRRRCGRREACQLATASRRSRGPLRPGTPRLVALRPPPGDPYAKKYEEQDRNPYGPEDRKEERKTEVNKFGIEQAVLKPLELFQVSIFGELREPFDEGDFTYRWQREEGENWPVCPRGLYPENYPLSEVLKAEIEMPNVREYDIDERVDHIRELPPTILDMLRADGLLRSRERRGTNETAGTRKLRGRRSRAFPATFSAVGPEGRTSRREVEGGDEEALFDEVDEGAFGEEVIVDDGEPADLDIEDATLLGEEELSDSDLGLDEIIDEDAVDLDADYDDSVLAEDTVDYEDDVGDDIDGYQFDTLDDELDDDFDYDGGFGSRATGPVGLSDDFDYE